MGIATLEAPARQLRTLGKTQSSPQKVSEPAKFFNSGELAACVRRRYIDTHGIRAILIPILPWGGGWFP